MEVAGVLLAGHPQVQEAAGTGPGVPAPPKRAGLHLSTCLPCWNQLKRDTRAGCASAWSSCTTRSWHQVPCMASASAWGHPGPGSWGPPGTAAAPAGAAGAGLMAASCTAAGGDPRACSPLPCPGEAGPDLPALPGLPRACSTRPSPLPETLIPAVILQDQGCLRSALWHQPPPGTPRPREGARGQT